MYIAVVGPGKCDEKTCQLAREVGRLIAERGGVVVCGGLGGVMDAAADGASAAGGRAVGILPGDTRAGASRHLSVAIPTGLGEARNALVVRAADAVIAIAGEYGTLSEIGLALKIGRPVIGLRTWELHKAGRKDAGVVEVSGPEEAVRTAYARIGGARQV